MMSTFLLGGLALFLFAIQRLSTILQSLFSDEVRELMRRYTNRVWSAILVGLVATVILDSSSAVIILTIVFVNADLLNLRRAVALVMGANIGTTVSSQIIALNIAEYLVYAIPIGLIWQFAFKDKEKKKWGLALAYLGMLFFGLFIIEESVYPLRDSETFALWMQKAGESAVWGAGIGGLVTVILQSSSATVGMAIILVKEQLISLSAGVAIMIGAELGTCADTLVATIKGSRAAIKTGIFHLVFNFCCVVLGLILFRPFMSFLHMISDQNPHFFIANAHVFFNVLGVLLFLPLIPVSVRLLNNWIPDKVDNK